MRKAAFCSNVLVIAFLWLNPNSGHAQGDPAAEVASLNQKAMADYQNMKLDSAVATLQKAEGICLQSGLQGHEMALTYVNMGVIEAAGKQNEPAAIDFFTRALCLEPTILVDPLVSTPEVETVFNMAREQAASPDTCQQIAAGAIPPPPPGDFPPPPGDDFPPPPPGDGFDQTIPPPPPDTGLPTGPPPPQTDNIRHDGVTEQSRMTPVPLFTLVQPGTPVDKVVLFYRTFGERNYQQLEMTPNGEGYGATIGCDVLQSFDPSAIEYYIVIMDETGQNIGSAGNEMQPFVVSFVSNELAVPLALPGAEPPAQCTECPPWNPDCNAGGSCKQYGDMCSKNSDCCKGMICEDDMCAPGEDDGDDGKPFKPIFKNIISFGTGGGVLKKEEVKPYNRVAEPPYEPWIKTNERFCTAQNYSSDELHDCYDDHSRGVNIGGGIAWSKFHFRETVMFYLMEKLTIGASFRGGLALDPSSNVMKVAPLGMLMVGYRVLGSGKDMYELGVTLGFGGGFIQHKVTYDDCTPWTVPQGHPWWPDQDNSACAKEDINPNLNEWYGPGTNPDTGLPVQTYEQSYFRKSGFLAVDLGIEQNLWFTKNLGLNIGITFDALFPKFAVNGDIQLGFALRI